MLKQRTEGWSSRTLRNNLDPGMETPGYRGAVMEYIRSNALPREKFSHQPRLYHLACTLGAGTSFDDDILFAAAWMHDLGVFVGHRPEDPGELASWDHLTYALRVVPGILSQAGFPAEKIPGVLEAIRTHLPSGEPTTPEAVLLRDADILEQLGAVGILRTVCKIGRDTRFNTFPDALRSLKRAVEQLPTQLKTPAARSLAEPRIALLRTFLASAEVEGAFAESANGS